MVLFMSTLVKENVIFIVLCRSPLSLSVLRHVRLSNTLLLNQLYRRFIVLPDQESEEEENLICKHAGTAYR
jgi:uncharacterized protein YbaR (Trm112 family)